MLVLNLTVTGAATIGTNLTVTDTATVGALNVTQPAGISVTGNAFIGGILSVDGDVDINGSVTTALTVNGVVTALQGLELPYNPVLDPTDHTTLWNNNGVLTWGPFTPAPTAQGLTGQLATVYTFTSSFISSDNPTGGDVSVSFTFTQVNNMVTLTWQPFTGVATVAQQYVYFNQNLTVPAYLWPTGPIL